MRKAVAIALVKDGRVLMQQRDDKPDIVMPGHWGLPGGEVEVNETPKQAVVREFQEETGYKLKKPILFETDSYVAEGEKTKGYIFYEVYDRRQRIDCFEGKKMEFKSLEDLKEVKVIPRHDEFVKKALDIVKG